MVWWVFLWIQSLIFWLILLISRTGGGQAPAILSSFTDESQLPWSSQTSLEKLMLSVFYQRCLLPEAWSPDIQQWHILEFSGNAENQTASQICWVVIVMLISLWLVFVHICLWGFNMLPGHKWTCTYSVAPHHFPQNHQVRFCNAPSSSNVVALCMKSYVLYQPWSPNTQHVLVWIK